MSHMNAKEGMAGAGHVITSYEQVLSLLFKQSPIVTCTVMGQWHFFEL